MKEKEELENLRWKIDVELLKISWKERGMNDRN